MTLKVGLGDCFVVTGEAFLGLKEEERARVRLVHGRPRLTVSPFIKYGHAWLEDGDLVYDPSGRVIPRDLYYAVGEIDPAECVRYSYTDFVTKMVVHKTWGPWDISEDEEEAVLRKRLQRRRKRKT